MALHRTTAAHIFETPGQRQIAALMAATNPA
jgi:hypothetical protein